MKECHKEPLGKKQGGYLIVSTLFHNIHQPEKTYPCKQRKILFHYHISGTEGWGQPRNKINCIYRTTSKSVSLIPTRFGENLIHNFAPYHEIVSKLLEKVVYNQIYDFITNHKILSPNQFGFRKKTLYVYGNQQFVRYNYKCN